MSMFFDDVEVPIDNNMIEVFPEMYHGHHNNIFQAVYELKRLIKRMNSEDETSVKFKVKPIELLMAVDTIETELINHLNVELIGDKQACIKFDLGHMTEEEYNKIHKREAPLHYRENSESEDQNNMYM